MRRAGRRPQVERLREKQEARLSAIKAERAKSSRAVEYNFRYAPVKAGASPAPGVPGDSGAASAVTAGLWQPHTYTYISTHAHADRHTDTQTHRHTDTQSHSDTHTDTHTRTHTRAHTH